MKPIRIDFGWQGHRIERAAGIALLVVALAGLVGEGWLYFQSKAEAENWQADRRRLDRLASASTAEPAPLDRERLQTELRIANRVIDKLDLPWDALFGSVEAHAGEQAILLGVEPDAERREVRITGEAKDALAMLDYVREMRRAPALRSVHLTGHQVNTQDPQRPVRFTLDAQWVEPPPAPKPVNEDTAPPKEAPAQ